MFRFVTRSSTIFGRRCCVRTQNNVPPATRILNFRYLIPFSLNAVQFKSFSTAKSANNTTTDAESPAKESSPKEATNEPAQKYEDKPPASSISDADFKTIFLSTVQIASKLKSVVTENVKLAWSEMLGETKESSLKKQVQQASSFRRAGEGVDKKDDNETEQYEGPTAIVVVKDRGSAWDQMKYRLGESPLIKEILKKSRNFSKAAGHTDVGKKVLSASQNLKDKIGVRYFSVICGNYFLIFSC